MNRSDDFNGDGDINNNQSVEDRVKKRYKQLIEEGSCEVGVDPNIDPRVPPSWFDEQRFQRSQQTASRYLLSLKWASFSGLLLGIQVPVFLEPLLITGHHETVSKLFSRYLDTEIKISSWYESDPFDESSEAYRSLRAVRGMHQSIFKSMNDKTNRLIGKHRLWVSQFQMAITQAGFFGLLITHPLDCFAHGITDTELEDIIYLWRVLGYLNGVQDKYNLCSGGLTETRAYISLINQHYVIPQIKMVPDHPYPLGYQVAQGIVDAFHPVQSIRWKVFRAYWYNILNIQLSSPESLTWFEQFLLEMTKITFRWILRVNFIYSWFSGKAKRQLAWVKKNRSSIESKLVDKYPDRKFRPNFCPYKVTLDSLTYPDAILDENQNSITSS